MRCQLGCGNCCRPTSRTMPDVALELGEGPLASCASCPADAAAGSMVVCRLVRARRPVADGSRRRRGRVCLRGGRQKGRAEMATTSAERMRLKREREQQGYRCLAIDIHEDEIEALMRIGLLDEH